MTNSTPIPQPPESGFPYKLLRGEWKRYEGLPADFDWSKEAKDKQISERAEYIFTKEIADIFDSAKNFKKTLAGVAISILLLPISIIAVPAAVVARYFIARHQASKAVKDKIAERRLDELKFHLNDAASTEKPISFRDNCILPTKLRNNLLSLNTIKDNFYKQKVMVEIQRHLENKSLDARTKIKQLLSADIFKRELSSLDRIIDEFEKQIKAGPVENEKNAGSLDFQLNQQYKKQFTEIQGVLDGDTTRLCPNVVINGKKYNSWYEVRTEMETFSTVIATELSVNQNDLNKFLNYLTTQAATSLLTGPLIEVASEQGSNRKPKECFTQMTTKDNDWNGDIEFRFEDNVLEVKYKMGMEFKHYGYNVSVGTGLIAATLKIDDLPNFLKSLPSGNANFSFSVDNTSTIRPSSTPVKPKPAASSDFDSSSPSTSPLSSGSDAINMTTNSLSSSPSSQSPSTSSPDTSRTTPIATAPLLLPNNKNENDSSD